MLDRALKSAHLLLFALACMAVLAFQSYLIGFPKGHHGWVSSGNLAIVSKSTLENGFVGYMFQIDDNGKPEYSYFRRTPFLSSVVQQLLTMTFFRSLEAQVFANRQFMNLVFLLSMWLAFLVMRGLIATDACAMGAVFLAFSGYFPLFYKDMICPDNFSVTGLFLMLYGIHGYLARNRRRALYLCAGGAAMLGWGYSALPIPIAWAFLEAAGALPAAGYKPASWLRAVIRLESVRVSVFAVAVCASCIGYNIAVEAIRSGASPGETSIVEAALRRTNITSESTLVKTKGNVLKWGAFLREQRRRIEETLYPYRPAGSRRLGVYGALVCLLAAVPIAVLMLRTWDRTRRITGALLFASGFLWLIPMRIFAAFHDYSAVFYIGVPLIVFGALAAFLPRALGPVFLLLSFLVFGAANLAANRDKDRLAEESNWMIRDFQAIADRVKPGDKIYYDGGHEQILYRRPYITGYVLKDQWVALKRERADYAVSRKRRYNPYNLTPENRQLFLFSNPRVAPRPRPSPGGRRPR